MQGRAMSSVNSIASEKLARLVGTPKCPALLDVRPDDDFSADPRLLPGSVRRSADGVDEWAAEFRARSTVVICRKGMNLSHGVAGLLREAGPLLAGALGGLLATWVTFTPCFLWIFAGAPYIEQLRGNKPLSGALSAITAAVVGVVLNLALWFAVHTVFRATRHVGGFGLSFDAPVPASLDVWSLVLALGAAIAIFRFKVGMIPALAGSCAAGAALHAFGLVA
jgi:rhodanese-related sulfurtransferase